MKKIKNEKLKITFYCLIGLVLYIIASTLSKSIFRNQLTQTQNFSNSTIDSVYSNMKEEFNQFETLDELQDKFSKNIKESEITEVSIPMGFFMQANLVKEFCEPTGYIPEKYITMINSYNKNIDFDEQWIEVVTKTSADRNQALYSLTKQKEMLADLFNDFAEKNYQNLLQTNPEVTKQDYCKLFDDYADESIPAKIEEIKKIAPKTYQKYFAK